MRSALLASKRAIDSKASSNREELLRSSALKSRGGKSTDDTVMKAQADVTDALRRTMALMQSELERSVLSTQMLEASTASLKATSSTHDVLTGLLGTSKQLVTALEKADWLDRLLIFAALLFFALVILFILKQRIVDRGLRIAFWWTRFLPSMHRGDSRLVANEVVVKATMHTTDIATLASSIVSSMTTVLASQVSHASGSSGDPESTNVPDKQHDISDVLPHVTVGLEALGSSLTPSLTTSLSSETAHLESIHDEL